MSRWVQERARLLEVRRIGARLYWLIFESPRLAAESPPRPGQFVHVLPGAGRDPLLRRPMSVLDFDAAQARLELYLQVFGEGSRMLASTPPGSEMDILGSLGRGFRQTDPEKPLYLIAGGVGLAPLYFWSREISRRGQASDARPVQVLLGARSAGEFPGGGILDNLPFPPHLATDDGSLGYHGTVVDLLEKLLDREAHHVELAGCGPPAMLAALARVARGRGLPCQVCLEQVMGCAIGACQGCVVPAHLIGRESGSGAGYARVCTEGPVFEAEEVDWGALAGRGLFAALAPWVEE